MQQTENHIIAKRPRLTIRIAGGTISFSAIDNTAVNQIVYVPYSVRGGVSIAANLREAFNAFQGGGESDTVYPLSVSEANNAMVMLDTPVLMVPLDEYFEERGEESDRRDATLYHHAISGHENDVILSSVLPTLNAVALFSINKDLKLVIDERFEEVKYMHLCMPVWKNLHRRSFTGPRRKLYGYFHEKRLEVFSFQQNRFRFCNSFDASHTHDAVYFLLYVWQQLGMDQRKDELHLVGSLPDRDVLMEELRKFLQNAYVINPAADFNRAPITNIKDLPYDLMTFYIKGR
ncbi:MAG: DUF3822 family protein [Prevotella sp.]|nr:DUF3822 family protein [Prevotella sp.]MBR1462563.1 DUF3822 family protein [Prevotella sp.]